MGNSESACILFSRNLLTFDDMPINVDPETVSERLSSYPLNKTHSFGVNITF